MSDRMAIRANGGRARIVGEIEAALPLARGAHGKKSSKGRELTNHSSQRFREKTAKIEDAPARQKRHHVELRRRISTAEDRQGQQTRTPGKCSHILCVKYTYLLCDFLVKILYFRYTLTM